MDKDCWSRLKEPFPQKDIEWRIARSGKNTKGIWAMCLAYVTNRAIMDRLDEVLGPDKWYNEFKEGPHGGVICGISIFLEDRGEYGEFLTKWDGAENTNIEAIKGGLSGAMKRAAVQWGIGRYLYNFKEGFATITDNGEFRAKTKEGTNFKWNPPALPEWALPKGEAPKPPNKAQTAYNEKFGEGSGDSADLKSKTTPKESDIKKRLKKALSELCSGDKETMKRILKECSVFKGKDGKEIFIDGSEGIDNTKSEKWLGTTLKKIEKRLEGGEPPDDFDDIPY